MEGGLGMAEIDFMPADFEQEKRFGFSVVVIRHERRVATCRLGDWDQCCPMISDVVVEPELRRQGIATFMLQECVKKAREAGKEAVTLSVRRKNEAAVALYRKLGFVVTLTSEETFWMSRTLMNADVLAGAFSRLPTYLGKLKQWAEWQKRGSPLEGHFRVREFWIDLLEKSNSFTRPEVAISMINELGKRQEEMENV